MIAFDNRLPDPTACRVGLLALRCAAPPLDGDPLEPARLALEADLRRRYAGLPRAELRASHPIDVYAAYYRRFRATYHVLLQVESTAAGRPMRRGLPLVQAMFMAELDRQLLTAGHDLDLLQPPVRLALAGGGERYAALGGQQAVAVAGDLLLADGQGVLSTILQGPAAATAISAQTCAALYTVYAPAGIAAERVLAHLDAIAAYVRLCAPNAATVASAVLGG